MAHVAPAEYAFHGREGPYGPAGPLDYYGGPVDPAFQRPQTVGPSFPANNVAEDASALADALAGIEMAQSARGKQTPGPNKELVVHAIEAAASVLRDQASALRDQISENERLRSALRVREWELQNYKVDQYVASRYTETPSQDGFSTVVGLQHVGANTSERHGLRQGSNQLTLSRDLWAGNGISGDPQSSLIVHPNSQIVSENHYRYPPHGSQGQHYAPSHGANGMVRALNPPDGGYSQPSSPSARSMSPSRVGREADPDSRIQLGSQGNAQHMAEPITSNGLWMKELVQSTPRPQEEITQLQKSLSDARMKELQLVHEKFRLEKRISEMRLDIEKYQQELVAIRQQALEENARLTSELQAADQDINFYASSLLPLLAEFNLQPATRDPHSIVSGIKALVQPLRDEVPGRKDSLPHKHQRRTSPTYQPTQHFTQSPIHPMVRVPQSPDARGLEIVPSTYSQPERPLSPTSPLTRTPREWEPTNQRHPFSTDKYLDSNDGRHPTYSGQTPEPQFGTGHGTPMDYSNARHPQMNELYTHSDDDLNTMGPYGLDLHEKVDRPSRPLATLPEEPTSSLSDEEDPLPDIEGLCINGEAVLGRKINAFGISINGTTLCHFQWVRHFRDGSFCHIPGAAQPEYTITADDIDTILSLECTPMDDRNRKGEMVQVFVNNQNWIILETDMKDQIIEYLDAGQAIFEVKLVVENSPEISFEPALLTLKRSAYDLKWSNGRKLVASERYVSESTVEIKVGKDAQCAICNSVGIIHLLECDDNRTRDLVVLTMRGFITMADERKKAKRRLWLTKK